jgi:PucR C-terminal helix-turn-helix domain
MIPIPRQPWRELPPEAASVFAPGLPALADEIIQAISQGVPEYALPLEGAFGRGLRRGVEEALRRFLDLFGSEGDEADPRREIYVALGRGELRAGRPLEALLAAYRLGARVAWRSQAAAGEAAGLEPHTLYLLAESIFAYIDEISAESVEGYALEQAAAAGEVQRRRRRLARLLIQEPPADPEAVRAAAEEAGWPLPDTLAALVVRAGEPDALALRLGQQAIAAEDVAGVCALVPDPDAPGRRSQLEAALRGTPAALGPAGPPPRAALSAARARAALALDAGEGLVVADDHRLELLLAADRPLARDLAEARLAPLAGETEASRVRLTRTLAAWLDHQGRTERVAAALAVHPQTVRYRVGRLRELFGDALEDPDARRELSIALAVPV